MDKNLSIIQNFSYWFTYLFFTLLSCALYFFCLFESTKDSAVLHVLAELGMCPSKVPENPSIRLLKKQDDDDLVLIALCTFNFVLFSFKANYYDTGMAFLPLVKSSK